MTPAELEQMISDIERDIDRLQALYNQYFMGIEKIEPAIPKKNLERKIQALRREQIKNTALRFRLQMQIQKFNTQSTYWNRVCKQIENGTYKRHLMLAKRRFDGRHGSVAASDPAPLEGLDNTLFAEEEKQPAFALDISDSNLDLDEPFAAVSGQAAAPPKRASLVDTIDDPFAEELAKPSAPRAVSPSRPQAKTSPAAIYDDDSRELEAFFAQGEPHRPSVPPPRTASRKPLTPPKEKPAPSPAESKSGLTKERAKAIYKKYLLARKKCNEPIDNLTFQKVGKTLQKTYLASGKNVDFKVVIRNGKAVIKTVKTGEES